MSSKMMPIDELQWESIIMRTLTLYNRVRLTLESYRNVLFKVSMLLFALIIFKMMAAQGNFSLVEGFAAFAFAFVLSFLLLKGLSYLTEVYGARRLTVLFLVMLAISVVIIAATA